MGAHLLIGRQVDDNGTSNVDSDVMFGTTTEYDDSYHEDNGLVQNCLKMTSFKTSYTFGIDSSPCLCRTLYWSNE